MKNETRCDGCGALEAVPFVAPTFLDSEPQTLCATCRRNELESIGARQYLHRLLSAAIGEYVATYRDSAYILSGLDEDVRQMAQQIAAEQIGTPRLRIKSSKRAV